jgi:predicted MFS family arabinose efflux permease
MSGIAVGQILGIPAGTIIAAAFGFKTAFLMFAVTMLVSTILIALFVPQPDVERSKDRVTLAGSIKTYLELIRRREIAASVIVYFLMFFSLGLYVIFLPTWIEGELSVSGNAIASLFLVGGIANVISGPMAGRISDSFGRKPMIIWSCLGLAVVMAVTTTVVTNMTTAYVFFALAMVMVSMRVSPLQSLLTELVRAGRRGSLMSLVVSIGQLGIGIGSAVAGSAFSTYGYASNTYAAAVSILLMAGMVHWFLPEPERRRQTHEQPDTADDLPVVSAIDL